MCSQRTAKSRHLHLRLDAHAWRELLSRAASLRRVLYASPQGRRPRWCRDGATCLSALPVACPNSSLPVRGRAALLSARGSVTSLGGALRGTTLSVLLCRARHGLQKDVALPSRSRGRPEAGGREMRGRRQNRIYSSSYICVSRARGYLKFASGFGLLLLSVLII